MNVPAPVRCWPEPDRDSAPPAPGTRRALFLDRDGVINVNHGYVHTPDQAQFLPGIFELARAACEAGFIIVVATNQAGIARGLYSEQEFLEFTRWLHEQFAGQGASLAATYYCPHHPTAGRGEFKCDCDCRKPKPGMILAAARDLNLKLDQCVMVGDAPSDMLASAAAGVGRAFWLSSTTDQDVPVFDEKLISSLLQLPAMLGWQDSPSVLFDSSRGYPSHD